MNQQPAARAIAFYLPQFHPVAENNAWWGEGFTEWTNTAKARPLFAGHYQPHVPADLGFYDLRLPEARAAQADLARRYGIEGFCYYHYWFAGRRILERPFDEVLASGEPDFPFCLCWANESWSGIWHGLSGHTLIEQTYPGLADHRAHFLSLLPAFKDRRYICVDGKPLFVIHKPEKIPDLINVLAYWRKLAVEAGLPGLYLAAGLTSPGWHSLRHGFDAKIDTPYLPGKLHFLVSPRRYVREKLGMRSKLPFVASYERFSRERMNYAELDDATYPCLIHAWDNTPRSGARGVVLKGSCPELFAPVAASAVRSLQRRPPQHRLLFLKSWNEWAEGNHLEPDLQFGHGYLQVLARALGVAVSIDSKKSLVPLVKRKAFANRGAGL